MIKVDKDTLCAQISEQITGKFFHIRKPFDDTDQVKVMSSYHCAEKPDLEKLPEDEKELHGKRHFAKKGYNPHTGEEVDPSPNAPDHVLRRRVEAAAEVVSQILTPEHVQEVAETAYEGVKDRDDKNVFLLRNSVHPNGIVSYNVLSPTYDRILIDEMNKYLEDKYGETGISFELAEAIRLNNTKRVYSTPIERLARQAYIDKDKLKNDMSGKNVIVVDEHVQSGAMVMTIFSLLKELEDKPNVLGVATLSSHPVSDNLRPCPQVNDSIKRHTTDEEYKGLQRSLQRVGLDFDTLSGREGLYVLALIMDGHNPDHAREFGRLEERLSGGITVVEGVEDDLSEALHAQPLKGHKFNSALMRVLSERADTFYDISHDPHNKQEHN